jgi:hypothetical protein
MDRIRATDKKDVFDELRAVYGRNTAEKPRDCDTVLEMSVVDESWREFSLIPENLGHKEE